MNDSFVIYLKKVVKMNAKSRRIRHNKRNNCYCMYFCGETILYKNRKAKSKKTKQKSKIIATWFRNKIKRFVAENYPHVSSEFTNI